MQKYVLNVHIFQNRNWCSPKSDWWFFSNFDCQRNFSKKKKKKLCMQNLTKEWKQPPVAILQQASFYNIFILCLWLRIIRRSGQGIYLMNFPLQIFFSNINHGYRAAILKKNYLWLLLFYMAVANYC